MRVRAIANGLAARIIKLQRWVGERRTPTPPKPGPPSLHNLTSLNDNYFAIFDSFGDCHLLLPPP